MRICTILNKFSSRKHIALFIVSIFLVSLLVPWSSAFFTSTKADTVQPLQLNLVSSVNSTNILNHEQYFASQQSRFTGYPGYLSSALYIYDYFKSLGLKTWNETYPVVIPYDSGSFVYVHENGKNYTAHALLPNGGNPCTTPENGIVGKMVYVGNGDFNKLKGVPLEDRIVLIDYHSKDRWLDLAQLGAKAFVFIEPGDDYLFVENSFKRTFSPLYVPRLIVNKTVGQELINLINSNGGEITITLKSGMRWKKIYAYNILAKLEAPEDTNESILLMAHYDSYSIVPAISPGAQDALGISSLLELARVLKSNQNNLKRDVIFLAVSGHYQSLAGARWFVERHYFTNNESTDNEGVPDQLAENTRVILNLDLSTDSKFVSMFYSGYFYYEGRPWAFGDPVGHINVLVNNIFGYMDALTTSYSQIGISKAYAENEKIYVTSGFNEIDAELNFETMSPTMFWLDSEPFFSAGLAALSFYTVYAPKLYRETPSDTLDKIIAAFSNLEPQLKVITYLIEKIIDEEPGTYDTLNTHGFRNGGVTGNEQFGKLIGHIVLWNDSEGWWDPWNTTKGSPPIIYVTLPYYKTYNIEFVTYTDKDGNFVIPGMHTLALGVQVSYKLEIYHFTKDGTIDYSTDYGRYGAKTYSNYFIIDRPVLDTNFVAFKTGALAFYKIIDPRNLLTPGVETIAYGPAGRGVRGVAFSYKVMDVVTKTEPQSFGIDIDEHGNLVIFASDAPILVTITKTGTNYPLAVLTNATEENPFGNGYYVKTGEYRSVPRSLEQIVRDFYYLNKYRIDEMHKWGVFAPIAEDKMNEAYNKLSLIETSYTSYDYSTYYHSLLDAYALEREAYVSIRDSWTDIINSILFVFALLIPFAYLFERLAFHVEEGKKRVIATLGIFVAVVILLYLMHPGFTFASNAYMTAVGIGMLFLTVPVLIIVFNDAFTFLKEARRKLLGLHFSEIARVSAIAKAFSVGVENMRRRKSRTILTLLTVTLVIFSLVVFASISTQTIIYSPEIQASTPYNGILIERTTGAARLPIDYALVDYVNTRFGANAVISVRYQTPPGADSWDLKLMNSSIAVNSTQTIYSAIEIRGLIALSPSEPEILFSKYNKSDYIIDGDWFNDSDVFSIILPQPIAKLLNAHVGDTVYLKGLPLRVKAIIDHTVLTTNELDGEWITPKTSRGGNLQPSALVIIPSKLARINPWASADKGIEIYPVQIAIKFNESASFEDLKEITISLAVTFTGLNYFLGYEGRVIALRQGTGFVVSGAQLLLMPIILGVVITFDTMLGSIHERLKEIKIYNALGLSPRHVAFLFLSEPIVYAVVGAVLGYAGGVAFTRIAVEFNLLPGIRPNYNSSAVLIAIGLAMLAVLASAIYPAMKVHKLSLPSLKRKWEMPTKPKGDEWEIPLPFVAVTKDEAWGILHYVNEYMQSFRAEGVGPMILEKSEVSETTVGEQRVPSLYAVVRIPPWKAELKQEIKLFARIPEGEKNWQFTIFIKRLQGSRRVWISANRNFVDEIRKQLLLWRGLSPRDKEKYISMAKR